MYIICHNAILPQTHSLALTRISGSAAVHSLACQQAPTLAIANAAQRVTSSYTLTNACIIMLLMVILLFALNLHFALLPVVTSTDSHAK
jgi:hypothetical protein